MADIVKQILARPIQLADQVIQFTDYVSSLKQDCGEIRAKTERLAGLLCQAAPPVPATISTTAPPAVSSMTPNRFSIRLQIVFKCRASGIRWLFIIIIPAAAVRRSSQQLENSIGDVSWLLRVSAPDEECR
ncbi:hypothetical protein Ccrd_024452 [Cynara cardunculus var. scolymus]|uniref:DUF7792 domain-containing protein n=1 Tax=Cynara cardunculus var. scolymus TaxID=59895 RepID=A0A103XCF7_CYNCS|nr:hypothetical protein Ccrd_024452 [Cynara cardunculus var. scolymus]